MGGMASSITWHGVLGCIEDGHGGDGGGRLVVCRQGGRSGRDDSRQWFAVKSELNLVVCDTAARVAGNK